MARRLQRSALAPFPRALRASACLGALAIGVSCSSSSPQMVEGLRTAMLEREAAQLAAAEARLLKPAAYLGPGVAPGESATGRFAEHWVGRAPELLAIHAAGESASELQQDAGADASDGASTEPGPGSPPLFGDPGMLDPELSASGASSASPLFANGAFSSERAGPVQVEAAGVEPGPAASPGLDLDTRLQLGGYELAGDGPLQLHSDGAARIAVIDPTARPGAAERSGDRVPGCVVVFAGDATAEAALRELAVDCARDTGVTLPWPRHRIAFLLDGSAAERERLGAAVWDAGGQGAWRARLQLRLDDPGGPAVATMLATPGPEGARDVERTPAERTSDAFGGASSADGLTLFGRSAMVDVTLACGRLEIGGLLPAVERAHRAEALSSVDASGDAHVPELIFLLEPEGAFTVEQLAGLGARRAQLLAACATTAWGVGDARGSDLTRMLETWLAELRLRTGRTAPGSADAADSAVAVGPSDAAAWDGHLQAARQWLRQVCLGLPAGDPGARR